MQGEWSQIGVHTLGMEVMAVSFRDRMRVKVSNAEMALQLELQNHGLNRGLETQKGFAFCEAAGMKGTTVDFYWDRAKLAVFLDGPHHLKERQSAKDAKVDRALAALGIATMRFPYTPPITKRQLEGMWMAVKLQLDKMLA